MDQRPGPEGADLTQPGFDDHRSALLTDTPRMSSPTTEQQIRGKDGAADWIVLLSGYDPDVIKRVTADQLSLSALHAAGARDNPTTGSYRLAFTMTPQDVAAA
jgi:hypothetical protein